MAGYGRGFVHVRNIGGGGTKLDDPEQAGRVKKAQEPPIQWGRRGQSFCQGL